MLYDSYTAHTSSDYYFIDQKIAEENPEAYHITEEMITELTKKLQNQNKERREQNN
ncbi:MAG: hypothetical protein K5879_00920 [Lachnospiraceae bacterium]|nr:hypothetical protein [Lachnospiraceae bacterium]